MWDFSVPLIKGQPCFVFVFSQGLKSGAFVQKQACLPFGPGEK